MGGGIAELHRDEQRLARHLAERQEQLTKCMERRGAQLQQERGLITLA